MENNLATKQMKILHLRANACAYMCPLAMSTFESQLSCTSRKAAEAATLRTPCAADSCFSHKCFSALSQALCVFIVVIIYHLFIY